MDACIGFNEGKLGYDEMISNTVKKGFNNVIDAFHTVNRETIPSKFYKKDYSNGSKKIILTDEIFKLQELIYFNNFISEVQSRWNRVETAWELKISHNLLNISYDHNNQILLTSSDEFKRKDVTSGRDALNGYQKGKCSYCFDDITLDSKDDNLCDVDSFLSSYTSTSVKRNKFKWNMEFSVGL